MEKEEKKQGAFNENAKEQQEQEVQKENVASENTEEQPKKSRFCKRVVIFLFIAAVVGVSVILITKSCKNEDEYGYEYGEEPDEGYVSYNNGKSNIINPTTKEVIVKDIDWCHYSSNSDEDPIVLFAKNGKRGFCNIVTNEVIVEPTTYTKAWIFSEGLAAVEKNGFIGFVNPNGDVAIKFKFSYRGNPLT